MTRAFWWQILDSCYFQKQWIYQDYLQ